MSQLLTLYTTPVVYLFFDRLRLRFRVKQLQTVSRVNDRPPGQRALAAMDSGVRLLYAVAGHHHR